MKEVRNYFNRDEFCREFKFFWRIRKRCENERLVSKLNEEMRIFFECQVRSVPFDRKSHFFKTVKVEAVCLLKREWGWSWQSTSKDVLPTWPEKCYTHKNDRVPSTYTTSCNSCFTIGTFVLVFSPWGKQPNKINRNGSMRSSSL